MLFYDIMMLNRHPHRRLPGASPWAYQSQEQLRTYNDNVLHIRPCEHLQKRSSIESNHTDVADPGVSAAVGHA